MHKKILHGLDGSEGSLKALLEAISIAKLYNAELHALTVEAHLSFPETLDEVDEEKEAINGKYRELLDKATDLANRERIEIIPHFAYGHEVKAFVELIEKEKFDLLVIGFMGHSRLFDRIWGGTSQNLTRLAPCTVMVVK